MQKKIPKLLLTGRPGCGKTTVIIRLAELLEGKNIRGFYTQEIRSAGQRSGFSVRTFGGMEGILSSVHITSGPQVGGYRVDVRGFEEIVLAELSNQSRDVDVFLIDEIGKMECFSQAFVRSATRILEGDLPLVATVALKGGGFIADAKTCAGVEAIEVTTANRNTLAGNIADRLAFFIDNE